MNQQNLNNTPDIDANNKEKNVRLRQIYNNFLIRIRELRKNFNTKIFDIVKKQDEQKEAELRNKIKQL